MYAKLFEKLLSGNVEFLILGGAAVSLHGFPRMTTDIDILLKNSPENIRRFVSVTGQWGDGCGYADHLSRCAPVVRPPGDRTTVAMNTDGLLASPSCRILTGP